MQATRRQRDKDFAQALRQALTRTTGVLINGHFLSGALKYGTLPRLLSTN
jgi:hypothetical protein